MFGGSKPKQTNRPPRSNRDLSQFGLMNVPDPDGLDDDDAGLEDELNALMGGGAPPTKKKNKKVVSEAELSAMVNACMEDVDEDLNDDDINDAELLGELEGFINDDDDDDVIVREQPIYANNNLLKVIESRITMYSEAERKARENNDNSRIRRFNRGLTTLKQLRQNIQTGKPVDENDIPPVIATNLNAAPPPVITPITAVNEPEMNSEPEVIEVSPSKIINVEESPRKKIVDELRTKRDEYRSKALQAKSEGDKTKAIQGLKAIKIIDGLIKSAENGERVDLSDLDTKLSDLKAEESPPKLDRTFSRDDPIQLPDKPEDIPAADPAMFGAPPPPATILEALDQRLERYKKDEEKAKSEGNNSKARRLGRICKQYTDAIKAHKTGKAIQTDDLPTPLGFPPIPTRDKTPVPSPKPPSTPVSPPKTATPKSSTTSPPVKATPTPPAKKHMSLQEKQLDLLEKRQLMFKKAALEAKKSGQIEQAKEYLRQSKGFDKLIDASKGGLPVDINTLPVPPQMQIQQEMAFEIISTEDCEHVGNRQEMYSKLENELIAQVKMCVANQAHFKSTGDIPSANKFQQMESNAKKDLDALRFSFKRGDSVPKFHYEVRSFSRVQCNIDLSDLDLEISIVSGVNYLGSKEMDTYVKFEFPYPKETPFKDKTPTVKDSINPAYEHKIVMPLNPKEKSCQRIFKRQTLKCEVMSKGGFLRSDTCIGTVQVKLQPLETQCTLHDSYPLMDGRKAVGGKLEVKLRLRNPILTKQIEKVQEKWLVITF